MKLFKVSCDIEYQAPLLENPDVDEPSLEGKEWRSLCEGWHPLAFTFEADERITNKGWCIKQPDLCLYNDGLFFRGDLVDVIFPEKPAELEFLPVLIDGDDWWLLNCLKTTRAYDPKRSRFSRGGERQQIDMIDYLVLHDATVEPVGLFTLEDSNRYSLLATESFVERIHKLDLKGVDFDEIGVLEPRHHGMANAIMNHDKNQWGQTRMALT